MMAMFMDQEKLTQVRWQHEEDVDDCNSCKVKIKANFENHSCQHLRLLSLSPNDVIIVGTVVDCSVPSVSASRYPPTQYNTL